MCLCVCRVLWVCVAVLLGRMAVPKQLKLSFAKESLPIKESAR